MIVMTMSNSMSVKAAGILFIGGIGGWGLREKNGDSSANGQALNSWGSAGILPVALPAISIKTVRQHAGQSGQHARAPQNQTRSNLNATVANGGNWIRIEWSRAIHCRSSLRTPPRLPTLLPPYVSASVLMISR